MRWLPLLLKSKHSTTNGLSCIEKVIKKMSSNLYEYDETSDLCPKMASLLYFQIAGN
jgi:hypothetical protein